MVAIVLGVLAAIVALGLIAAAGVLALRTSSDSSSASTSVAVEQSQPADTSESTTTGAVVTDTTTDTTADTGTDTTSGATADPTALLVTFADTWNTGNWDGMSAVANNTVVSVAQEWYEAGGTVNITGANMSDLLACTPATPGANSTCEFMYVPPEGFALLFRLEYQSTDSGLQLTNLIMMGDAG